MRIELVESILASVQWDRWRFYIPTAKPLLKQDVAVTSHGHSDHWHQNFSSKDIVLAPREIRPPEEFANLKNITYVDFMEKLGKIKFFKIGRKEVEMVLAKAIKEPLHAFWWLAEAGSVRVLFVGDMNVADAEVLQSFCNRMPELGRPLHGILLPSFSGVKGHGSVKPVELMSKLPIIADVLRRRYSLIIGALPHPVRAEWADINATRL